MIHSIQQWLAPPIFEGDSEKTRRASLLNASIFGVIMLSLFAIIGHLLSEKVLVSLLGLDMLMVIVGLLLRYGLQRDKVELTSILMVVLGFLFTTLTIIHLGTIRAPNTTIYLFLIIFSATVFRHWRGIAAVTLASSLAVLGLIFAENAGALPQPDYAVSVAQWITFTILFAITGGVAFLRRQIMQDALERAECEIKARKEAEAALWENEEKFLSVIEYAPSGILLTDEQGVVVEWNAALEQILGIPRQDALGQPFWDVQFRLTPPERKTPAMYENVKNLYRQIFASGKIPEYIREMDIQFQRLDGKKRDLHFVVSTIKTSRGFRLVGLSSDITGQKKTENELRKLTRAVEQSPASIVITDLHGAIEYVNPRFTQTTGYSLEEAIGKNPRILKTEETPPETYRQLWETISAGKEWRGEFINQKKDGSVYYESAAISPVIDQNGVATHYLAVKEDVTERKKSEELLQKLSQAVEQSGNSVIIMDRNGRIEYVNPKFVEVSGYALEDVLGKSPAILYGQGDDYDFTQDEAWKTIMTGRVWHGEFCNLRKDGALLWESATVAPVLNRAGEIINFVEIKQDITQQKALQEQIQKQNEYFAILHQTTLDLLNRRNMSELFQVIVDRAVALLDAPFVDLMLEQHGELVTQAHTSNQDFLKGERVGRGEAKISWQAFDTKQPVVLDDYSVSEHRRDAYVKNAPRATADFPIIVRDQSIGVLAVGRSQPGYKFSESQIQNGMLFAQLAALVLDSAQLFAAAQHEIVERKRMEDALFNQNQFLAILHQTTLQLLKSRDVSSLLNIIVTQAAEFVGASYGNIFLSEDDDLVLRAAISSFVLHIGNREKKPGAGVLGQVWQTMKPFVVNNYEEWQGRDPAYADINLRAIVGIPIIGREGPLGVLEVARLEEDAGNFTGQEIEMFVQFAALASLVLDNAQLYAQAQNEIAERQKAEALVEAERKKADDLLLNILPYEIAARLKEDNTQLIADRFEQTSILFADVVNFTPLSTRLSPDELVQLLDEIFSYFDALVEKRGLEKIKTIGDAYMAVAGVPRPMPDHARELIRLALDFQSYVSSRSFYGQNISLRIGVNSGPVVAGVIGNKKFAYDLWGDAVNVASRMESQGEAGAIQITEATYKLIHESFICEARGSISVKGKGEMRIWHVISERASGKESA